MRLIDADKLERNIMSMPDDDIDEDSCYNVINVLDREPTIDAVPVVHGEWIWDIDGMDWGIGSWKCKNCHARPNTYWQCDSTINPLTFAGSSYCPNCGAKMDGERKTKGERRC